jgi:hypothetical protein
LTDDPSASGVRTVGRAKTLTMEVAVGIDELNWYGPTVEPFVLPIRQLFDKHCTTDYCPSFDFIDYALRVGDPKGGVGRVGLNRRASSISIDILLDIVPDQFPVGVPDAIVSGLEEAAEKIVQRMQRSEFDFDGNAFRSEFDAAIAEYEATVLS